MGMCTTSCKKEDDTTGPVENTAEVNAYETINCSTVFDSGDYSHLCGIDSTLPTSSFFTLNEMSTECVLDVTNEDGEILYLLITDIENSVEIADEQISNMIIWGSGNLNDINQTFESVSNVGDKAKYFSYEDEEGILQMALFAHSSNAVISLFTSTQNDGTESCHANLEEMSKFVNEYIKNL